MGWTSKVLYSLLRKGMTRIQGASRKEEHTDSMKAQALEQIVDQTEFDNERLGVVKINPRLRERLLGQLGQYVSHYLETELGITNKGEIEKDIWDFYESLEANPARDATLGATGDGLNLWLHLLTRQLQPTTIVESGVFVGRSLYTLRHASNSAQIHAFDLSFSRLLFKDASIHYHQCDWSKSNITCQNIGFCYFDDHINNGRRIREAYDKGFTHLVFDQCAPIGMLHLYRYPGLPNALMLGEKMLEEGDILEWTWRGKKLRYRFEKNHAYGAEDLIELVKPLPSLSPWLGINPGEAAYVKLKPITQSAKQTRHFSLDDEETNL